MGMAPVHHDGRGELLIDELFKQGQIDARVFSLSIGDQNKDSFITLGGHDLERFAQGALTWHSLASNTEWMLNMDGVSLGGRDLNIKSTHVVVDSGSSYLVVPPCNEFESNV